MEYLVHISWFVTFLTIIAIYLAPVRYKANFAILIILINALATSWFAIQAINGNAVHFSLNAGTFLGEIPIKIDGLSAWFILIINFTCITGVLYGKEYLKAYTETGVKITFHWTLFILFHLSMLWVCVLQHTFAFLVAWEVMSLTSMLLVIFDSHNQKTIRAGINYLVQMHISVVFLTIGFLWIYFQTGSFQFSAISQFFNTNTNVWLFLIFFVGFGLKAGFIPLHSWLPHAHPAAPSHISGVMSGVIVKLGIYGIIRIISFLKTDFVILGEIVLSVAILSGLYGILNAAVQRDFKRMLAYCTIENIGIIGIGIGLGLIGLGNNLPMLYFLGFGGALLHVLNHSLFKSLLFYSAGGVYQQTHTRDMEKLGGLLKLMPKTAVVFLIGAIAIGGIPPFNGFVSEFIIYGGLMEGLKIANLFQICLLVLTFAGLSLIGGISILTFTKTFGTIFLGSPRETLHNKPQEVSFKMLLPQYLIIGVMLSVAFFPAIYLHSIGFVLQEMNGKFLPVQVAGFTSYSSNIVNISIYSLLFVIVIFAFWKIRSFAIQKKTQTIGATWGCGYVAPNNKMQYTGRSFSKPLGKIFNFVLIEEKHIDKLKSGEVFPDVRKYLTNYFDFFEHQFIDPIIHRLTYSANYFLFIQNGRIQSYVLYGIVFILAIFVLTVLEIIK